MNYWTGADWDDEVVLVEQPVYYDWDCPDGYTRDDWGQCVPEVTEVFVIEREILYLYPDLVATYPDLQLHPELLFRYRPELRTRYAGIRSVSELRNRYTSYHHTAPPQRPASASPAHGGAKAAQQRAGKTPGTQPSKHAQASPHDQPPAQQGMRQPPGAPPAHTAPLTSPPPMHGAPAQPQVQHAALTPPPSSHVQPPALPTSPVPVPKDKTATSGFFTEERSHYLPVMIVGGLIGMLFAREDESVLEFAAYGAACGAAVSVGASVLQRRHRV